MIFISIIFVFFIRFHYDKVFNANSEVLYGYEIEGLDFNLTNSKRAQRLFGRSMIINTRDKKHPGKTFN